MSDIVNRIIARLKEDSNDWKVAAEDLMDENKVLKLQVDLRGKAIEGLDDKVKELEKFLDNGNGLYQRIRSSIGDAEIRRYWRELIK